MEYVHLVVIGRVQGVWFRDYIMQSVEKYKNVTGFVHNQEDGSVEIVFEGKEKKVLKELIEKVKQGSPNSRVDHVIENWEEKDERWYSDFSRNF